MLVVAHSGCCLGKVQAFVQIFLVRYMYVSMYLVFRNHNHARMTKAITRICILGNTLPHLDVATAVEL